MTTVGVGTVSLCARARRRTDLVGHAWVEIASPDGDLESYGFWPRAVETTPGAALAALAAACTWRTPGVIRQPDTGREADARWTAVVDAEGLARGMGFVAATRGASYSLVSGPPTAWNCVSWAARLWAETTGEPPVLQGSCPTARALLRLLRA